MTSRILVDENTGDRFEVIPQGGSVSLCVLNEIKPEPKAIDWSKVSAEANIPARFWLEGNSLTGITNFYKRFDRNGSHHTVDENYWDHCTLDTGAPVAWFGGECPLPEGVMVRVTLRDGSTKEGLADCLSWYSGGLKEGEIIAFEVIGLDEDCIWNPSDKGE